MLFDGADGSALLDPERLAAAAARVRAHARSTAPPDVVTGPRHHRPRRWPASGDGDTTHLCAQDADGLGISLTQSNALDFGSHLVEPTTGIFLHNRGVGFSLEPGHPAEVSARAAAAAHPLPHARHHAGRRADATWSAPWAATPSRRSSCSSWPDCCGPATIRPAPSPRPASPSTHPRPGPSASGGARTSRCVVEADAPPAWPAGLTGAGHRVRTISAFDPVAVGCAQIIATERTGAGDGGGARRLVGASDPRSPAGAALGR